MLRKHEMRGLPVYTELLLAHHKLEIINDNMSNIIHVHSMEHGINYCPA